MGHHAEGAQYHSTPGEYPLGPDDGFGERVGADDVGFDALVEVFVPDNLLQDMDQRQCQNATQRMSTEA